MYGLGCPCPILPRLGARRRQCPSSCFDPIHAPAERMRARVHARTALLRLAPCLVVGSSHQLAPSGGSVPTGRASGVGRRGRPRDFPVFAIAHALFQRRLTPLPDPRTPPRFFKLSTVPRTARSLDSHPTLVIK
eukprot:364282-Chlamydomonas_euryale.AAC.6